MLDVIKVGDVIRVGYVAGNKRRNYSGTVKKITNIIVLKSKNKEIGLDKSLIDSITFLEKI